MRVLLYSLLFGSTTTMAGAALIAPDSLAQSGALCVLAGTVAYLLVTQRIALKAFLKTIKEERDAHQKTIERLSQSIDTVVAQCRH